MKRQAITNKSNEKYIYSTQTINNIHVASYKEKYRLRPILSNRPFTCMGPQIMIGLIDMNGNYENNRSFFLKRVM